LLCQRLENVMGSAAAQQGDEETCAAGNSCEAHDFRQVCFVGNRSAVDLR
jgi:hypothetical protein